MKHSLFIVAIAAATLTACEKSSNDLIQPTQQDTIPAEYVTIPVNAYGLQLTQGEFAPIRKADKEPTNLCIFENETLVYQGTSFSPTITIKRGVHSLTFIATYQTNPTFVDGIWQADKISDTYGSTHEFNTDTVRYALNILLSRVNYECAWKSIDNIPTTGLKATITFSNYRSTLLAGLAGGVIEEKVFSNVSLTQGKTLSLSASSYCAAYGVDETITTTLTIYDASSNIVASFSKDVPVLSNRRTVISGKVFGDEAPMQVSVRQDWEEQHDVAL